MDPTTQNFLYRNPRHYELVYPEPNEDTPKMCLRMFDNKELAETDLSGKRLYVAAVMKARQGGMP